MFGETSLGRWFARMGESLNFGTLLRNSSWFGAKVPLYLAHVLDMGITLRIFDAIGMQAGSAIGRLAGSLIGGEELADRWSQVGEDLGQHAGIFIVPLRSQGMLAGQALNMRLVSEYSARRAAVSELLGREGPLDSQPRETAAREWGLLAQTVPALRDSAAQAGNVLELAGRFVDRVGGREGLTSGEMLTLARGLISLNMVRNAPAGVRQLGENLAEVLPGLPGRIGAGLAREVNTLNSSLADEAGRLTLAKTAILNVLVSRS